MAHLARPQLPTRDDSEQAAAALRALQPLRGKAHVELRSGRKEVATELPRMAMDLLRDILALLANGAAVQLLPLHAKLTTQQAADFLNVSRPHLIKLLEEGKLAFERVGTHRRVLAADVLRYQAERDESAKKAASELTAEAEKLGLGY